MFQQALFPVPVRLLLDHYAIKNGVCNLMVHLRFTKAHGKPKQPTYYYMADNPIWISNSGVGADDDTEEASHRSRGPSLNA